DLHEAIVDDPAARRTYAAALARAAGEAASPSARAELLRRAAGAFPEAEDDDVRDAIAAAEKALALEPHAIDTRRMVVTLLRRAPQPSLVDHLFVLADATPDSLDALREAADTALGLEDDALARRALEALFERATTRWHQGQTLTGKHDAPSSARWALEKLTGLIDDRRVVAERLLRGGELPFSPEERSALNRRAADMFQQLDAPLRAIDAYRRALADAPEDVTLIRSLAFLCENEEARSGASALRERELALTEELTPRLSLRLKELERTGALGAGTRQLDLLRANLADAPGHPASVDAVVALLRERGAPRQLVEILEGQATQLEEKEETRRAAELWLRAAEVAEREVGDPGQAIRAYERAIAIDPTPRSYDALARLHMDRGQPVEAARWLSERLAIATDKEAVAVRLKLARARLAAGQETDAVTTLTEAFADAPQSAEVRKQLIPLLRQREDWRTLAATLVRSVEHTTDDAAVLAYAREAAEVLHLRLDAPAEAVEALRRAVTLAPDDRKLRSMLAEGLRARGDLDEAQDMLETTIKAFGRRGSRERAEAHIQLARVLHARGDAEAALAQLDVATKMDADNVASLQTLAEFAREAGELQRAEAALRMLLLTTRRLTADEARDTPIGTSEVLFELASLAQARGQDDQAEELAESAIEALAEGDVHAPRLQQRLRDKGEFALLARLLDARLRYVRSPYRRGQILHEKAEAWSLMGDASRALTARLEAVEADPGSPVLHEGLRELAEGQDALATYEEKLRALLEVTRRDTDAMVRCELLLRQAEIALVRGDHAETQARLDDAVQTGVREVDVLRAMARLAGERGDETEQLRILEQLASLGEDQVASRADALYRMAEVQLAAEDSLEVGLASLRRAIGDNPSPKRAATILRRATERHPEHTELLDLYEQVVRDSGDDATILHYLERRADHGSASAEQIREATQRAESLGDEDRVGKLMRRAVELARERDDLSGFDWALLGLAERALSAGDVEEAVRWLQDAGEVAEAEALFALSRRVAEAAAGDGGKPELAAGLYEKLRERDAMARDAWEPLVRIYTQLDDLERLERVVRETLDGLQEVGDRNALRIGLAGALLRHDDRVDDAIVVTREALFDAPGDPEALSLLTQSLERAGRTEELSDLLRDQLAGAKERGDAETVKATATRLVGMLEAEPAAEVLRDALELGDDVDLIEALLERLGEDDARERAELVERQLELARDDAAAAASLAKRAAELFERAEEPDGVLRVLERGLEYAPSDVAIRDRLEAHYRSQNDHLGLTRILESTAASTDDPDRKVELMAEAARVHLDELNDAATAAQLLAQARVLHPTDAELTSAHARAVAAQGDRGDAIQILGEGLERCDEVHHLTLLTARADLRREEGDDDGVLADLETAFSLDADAVRESLSDALESRRMRAAGEDDQATERRVTLRIADLLQEAGRRDDARMMLTDFSDRHEDELEITQRLLSLARDEDQWEEVERLSLRLVDALEGDGQVEAAAHFFEACERQGQPENAREVLERVWAARPGDAKIRGEVRRLYELIGAHGELARLLIEEAQDIDDQDEKVAHLRWAGEALLSTGDLEPAVGALQQVLELVEDDAEALCLLADVRIMEADYTGAHQLLDDAIGRARRTSPTLFMLYQRKSYVHQAEGDPYAQLDALKRAYQAARKNPHVAAELADLAESLEDWDLAVTTLRAITAMEDQGPISAAHALVRQGRIALRLGDEKRAKLCARRAAMTQADDETVQAFLAEIGEG
ncbi:MAG: tetratricopeptide repeat protein, partial [Myxococcota bacterium]